MTSSSIETDMDTHTSITTPANPYFIMTITNFSSPWQQGLRGAILVPNTPIHFGLAYTENHEDLLYNTLRYQLEQCIRAYLQRTQRLYPIHLIFDFSHLGPQQ